MTKKDNTLEQIAEITEAIINFIVTASKWTWSNVSIVVGILLLANFILLIPIATPLSIINLAVFIIFAVRLGMDYRKQAS